MPASPSLPSLAPAISILKREKRLGGRRPVDHGKPPARWRDLGATLAQHLWKQVARRLTEGRAKVASTRLAHADLGSDRVEAARRIFLAEGKTAEETAYNAPVYWRQAATLSHAAWRASAAESLAGFCPVNAWVRSLPAGLGGALVLGAARLVPWALGVGWRGRMDGSPDSDGVKWKRGTVPPWPATLAGLTRIRIEFNPLTTHFLCDMLDMDLFQSI